MTVDGVWGPRTVEALRLFQRDNNMSATGSLDSQTIAKLGVDLDDSSGFNW